MKVQKHLINKFLREHAPRRKQQVSMPKRQSRSRSARRSSCLTASGIFYWLIPACHRQSRNCTKKHSKQRHAAVHGKDAVDSITHTNDILYTCLCSFQGSPKHKEVRMETAVKNVFLMKTWQSDMMPEMSTLRADARTASYPSLIDPVEPFPRQLASCVECAVQCRWWSSTAEPQTYIADDARRYSSDIPRRGRVCR